MFDTTVFIHRHLSQFSQTFSQIFFSEKILALDTFLNCCFPYVGWSQYFMGGKNATRTSLNTSL